MNNFIKLLEAEKQIKDILKIKYPELNFATYPCIDADDGKYYLQINCFDLDGSLKTPNTYMGFKLLVVNEKVSKWK